MSSKIAIEEYPGIINFLESLGGVNKNNLPGGNGDWIPFSINEEGVICCPVECFRMSKRYFIEQYMFEIGSKVKHKNKLFPCRIKKIFMRDYTVFYILRTAFGNHIQANREDFVLMD